MSDKVTNELIYETLTRIQETLGLHTQYHLETTERLGLLGQRYASISRRVDRIDERLERVERRLDLVET
ncbi:hypothetical protein QTL95_08925 [Rhizobium sp. S152]|uniref:hypothetical protein n=1 Tax=Rhizobium sp. S152 TaxID=3055038 RepID=UPI0025AA0623|nr:hypothetical protein [Rhizobium sp. S152]MDM9626017.1 hypothetical protein [Rhizobium sp. S152]